jgi:two-component system response regulator AtoC
MSKELPTTEALSEAEITAAKKVKGVFGDLLAQERDLRLVVSTKDGLKYFDLPKAGQMTIGRTSDNDICIDDASLSRVHAMIKIGNPLKIVDLDSLNGTYLRSEPLESKAPVPFALDEPIDFGKIMAVVQEVGGAQRLRRLTTHAYFEMRLEEECARAQTNKSTFTVIRVHVKKDSPEDLTSALLLRHIRAMDTLALYAPGEFEILAPDFTSDQAQRLCDHLVEGLADHRLSPQCGVALFGEHGRSPEALLAYACDQVREHDAPDFDAIPDIIVKDEAMQRLYHMVERVAPGKISVLLLGETGTGKEILAAAIHRVSPRRDNHFLPLNCAALSETLLESELFGHEKGAFTGAAQAKQGLLESADGGTVFLDELGEMPLTTQAKLLRVIESGEVMRVGGLKTKPIDVRFVAATNRDLEEEIEVGNFRQDLFFRLNGMTLNIPPLRERPLEIEALAQLFVEEGAKSMNLSSAPRISDAVLDLFSKYSWPGNIRELRNCMERAVLLCETGVIEPEHLPLEKMQSRLQPGRRGIAIPFPEKIGDEDFETETQEIETLDTEVASVKPSPAKEEKAELKNILDALSQAGGNQSMAAKMLGVSRRTLIRRLETYGITRPRKN